MKKIKVGIIFGGKSAEHEVSLQSAKNVIDAIDKEKYEVILIGIDKTGKWHISYNTNFLLNSENPKLIKINNTAIRDVAIIPQSEGKVTSLDGNQIDKQVDVVFPILHGTFGEDGTIQGLLKLANVPFVGAGVLGSAVGMDKDVMKRLLRDGGVPIAKFITIKQQAIPSYDEVVETLGVPFYVKPANLGSSVGVSRVSGKKGYIDAINEAFKFDRKVLIEENIIGREIECAVLGNENPIASLVGEILPKDDFYSYEAKYINKQGAELRIPSKLPKETVKRVQDLAIKTFTTLECEGMGRVDCFLKDDGEIIINEINTIPGFTSISMYPKLWEISGISYTELIDRLLILAIDRFNKEQKLNTEFL